MTCKEFENLLTAYVEGELPPESRVLFERHIESCERCQSELSTYENCTRIFQRYAIDEDPPTALRKAVFDKCCCDDPSDCCPPRRRDK